MEHNGDFRYDLELGKLGEGWVGRMLSSKTIEVKFDFACYKTGNFYIEYESRKKPSGIATSQADYYMLIAATESGQRLKKGLLEIENSDILYAILISSDRLKKMCRERYFRKSVKGGDKWTSLGVLIKAKELL